METFGTSDVEAFPNPPNGQNSASNTVALQAGAAIVIHINYLFTLRPRQVVAHRIQQCLERLPGYLSA